MRVRVRACVCVHAHVHQSEASGHCLGRMGLTGNCLRHMVQFSSVQATSGAWFSLQFSSAQCSSVQGAWAWHATASGAQ